MSLQKERIIQIIKRLVEVFHPEKLTVLDESHHHTGHIDSKEQKGHFFVSIIAEKAFKNKNPIECHRMIYKALDDLMKTDIHALQIQVKNLDIPRSKKVLCR
ncbi:MAG: BolA family protein [Coxiella endosymbiont of Dermacentor silvarum]